MSSNGVFAHVRNLDRVEFEKFFERRKLLEGVTLCSFGDKGDSMYLVLSGRLEVRRPKRREGEFEVAANLSEGDIAGESSYVGNYERNATLVARGDTEILIVTKAGMGKLKAARPDISIAFYEGVLQQITERFRALANKKDSASFWL